ncbi:MAG: hypothetical protein ACK5RL_08535 [Acidimicrobiales bacterium]
MTRHHRNRLGGAGVVDPAREAITDTATAAGLWPFCTPNPPASEGTPLGVDPNSGRLVCYDPHTAFLTGQQRAAQLAILAANGTGKSALAKKFAIGLTARHISVIVPFDAKNEYGPLVAALGGASLRVDRTGGLHLLDPGQAITTATQLGAPTSVVDEPKARRTQLVATVTAISRGRTLAGWETTAIDTALNHLPPTAALDDLARVFTNQTDLLAAAIGRPVDRAHVLLEPLTLDLAALAAGPIGRVLGHPAEPWPTDRALVVDTSTVLMTEPALTAAVMVTAWTAALSVIHLANHTSHAGVPQQTADSGYTRTRKCWSQGWRVL